MGIIADQIGYSREINPVGNDFIMRHYDAYGGTRPPPILPKPELFDVPALYSQLETGIGIRVMSLSARAWIGLTFLAVAMALVLFVSTGTVHYWEAWFYLGVFFGASIVITWYLIEKDPALLRRRLSAGPTAEKEKVQKIVMLIASAGFIALLVVPRWITVLDGLACRSMQSSLAKYLRHWASI